MANKQINDSKDSKRGDFYQAIVAIKYAFEMQNLSFKMLTIEHQGDISFDNLLQVEVKHHKKKLSLSDNDEDIWKTFYNWIIQEQEFNRLILHTTAHFPTKGQSEFSKWNKISPEERYDLIDRHNLKTALKEIHNYKILEPQISILKSKDISNELLIAFEKYQLHSCDENVFCHILNELNISGDNIDLFKTVCKDTSNSKVLSYYHYITSLPKDKVIPILAKIEIKTDEPIDDELLAELANFGYLKIIPAKTLKDKKDIIRERIAAIIQSKVVGDKKWQITNEQFLTIIQKAVSDFFKDNYNPIFDKFLSFNPSEELLTSCQQMKFVGELEQISCDKDEIDEAIVDYWKTETLIGEEIENNPLFYEQEYRPYKEEHIFRKLKNKKREIDTSKSITDRIHKSKLFYRQSKEISIGVFRNIPDYFYLQHGTMQIIIEDPDLNFSWLYD